MPAPISTSWEAVVTIRQAPNGADVRALRPGRDLLLEIDRASGSETPLGVLLDDRLSLATRDDIDREAISEIAAWRLARDEELTLDGVCLPAIWEVELLAEVFLPEVRLRRGLAEVFAVNRPRRIILDGVDEQRAAVIQSALGDVAVDTSQSVPTPPAVVSPTAAPWRVSPLRRLAGVLAGLSGVPSRVQGQVLYVPYWHLAQVYDRLSCDGPRPVLDPGSLPPVGARRVLRDAFRGGWLGHPGFLARRRSSRLVGAALERAGRAGLSCDAFHDVVDRRARALLGLRASDTLALVESLRQGLSRGAVGLVLMPFDTPPRARMIHAAARMCGVPTLVVQHGLLNDPRHRHPEMTRAEHVAVWSDRDRDALEERAAGDVYVTGNPGLTGAKSMTEPLRCAPRGRTLVLVEYASRLSVRVDARVSMQHVETALAGLARARPGTRVTIRPHPAEHEPEIFKRLAASWGGKLRIDVDTATSIDDLLGLADLCIGAVSTATLQAGVQGVPVIFLNTTGGIAPWPFDGTGGVPVARDATDLECLTARALEANEVAGRVAMMEALGVRPDASVRVTTLVRDLAVR